jgi:hypothetical protein
MNPCSAAAALHHAYRPLMLNGIMFGLVKLKCEK